MKSRNYLYRALLLSLIFLNMPSLCSFRPYLFETKVFAQETKVEKKKLPPVNWARPRKFDVKHLAIDLRFDWAKKQAYGTTDITLVPFNSTNKITLDAAFFTINSITSQNGKTLNFEYDGGDKNDNLKITLDHIYQVDEEITLKVDYVTNWINTSDPINLSGSNGKGIRFFEPTSNDLNRPREIWSMGEIESNRYWFPSYDSPNDLRSTEFRATVDKTLTVISNGNLVQTKDNVDGTHTFYWNVDIPYANHLTSFVIGDYVDVKQKYENIELHNFAYPNEVKAVEDSTVRLSDMIKFYSEVTGVKYPYSRYSQVFAQDLPWGVANNMVSLQTENMIDDYRTHAEFFYLWDGLEAETLASQWFGNYLTCRDWSEVWLNRGFGHYFDGLYNEHKNGREEFLLWQVLTDQGTYLSDWNSGIRRPIVTKNYENVVDFASDNYSYSRSAMVLHMLRKHLGEEKWKKAISHYIKSNANKLVSTEDLRKAVEEASGEPMDWFFDQWVYKMGHPIFEVSKTYDESKKQLILNVKQTQKVDLNDEYPQVEFFRGKIEVEIDGQIEQVWLEPKAENVFSFASSQNPKLIHFDYESTWIKEVKFEKSLDELLYQLQNDKDVTAKRWAMDELVKVAKNERSSSEEKEKIYSGLCNLILSDSYWRLRLGAISQLQSLIAPSTNTKPALLDDATTSMLLAVIKNDRVWVRAAAIRFLGMTQDPKFADLYISYLDDESDRVINATANALGQSKSPKAFDALAKLVNKPSWKNQSLMSALNGLKHLGDPRGFDIAFKALSDPKLLRWRLPIPPVWDLRVVAVDTIVALGKSDVAYSLIFERFKQSVAENDLNGVFNNLLLINKLADPKGQEAFDLLKIKFKDNVQTMAALNTYETQFNEALKAKKT